MASLQTVTAPTRPPRRVGGGTGRWTLLLIPAGILLAVGVVYPLATLFLRSIVDPEPGLGNYQALWDSEVFRTVLARTFTTSAIVCLVCLALGYPYAYLMTVVSRRWREVMFVLVLIPLWTSLMVRTFSWLVLLQDTGLVNDGLTAVGIGPLPLIRNTTGVTIGMAQVMLPYAVLPMWAVMQQIDRRLLLAAESCGAKPAAAFMRIYVPLSAPGVMAAMSIVFILCLGFFITPQVLGSPSNALLSQLLFTEVTQLGNWGRGAAMGLILLVSTLLLLAVVGAAGRAARIAGRSDVRRGRS